MKREIFITEDGSTSLYLPLLNEQYHSKHGAIQEAYHVFIKHGFEFFKNTQKLSILEIGFGTGLNCFITFLEAIKKDISVNYVGIEAYPVTDDEVNKMNFVTELKVSSYSDIFLKMHNVPWEKTIDIQKNFKLTKRQQFFQDITEQNQYNLIYFDAFGANVQPELWTETIFKKMYDALQNNGIFVTYSAKGSVRRAMQSVGFKVERLPGPPGKREMLRGIKQY